MAKRFIGIDCDEREMRLAIAEAQKGEVFVRKTLRLPIAQDADLSGLWQQEFGQEPGFGDRAAAALPASRAFARRLQLPFRDADKIEAVLANELQPKLPLVAEKIVADFLLPGEGDEAPVQAVAAKDEDVAAFLRPFDEADIPLYCLDVAPFAYAAGLPSDCADSLLAVAHQGELTVSLVVNGRVADHRLMPASPSDDQRRGQFILTQGQSLERSAGYEDLPLYLVGDECDEHLLAALRDSDRQVVIPPCEVDGEQVSMAMLPAVLLARRAALRDRRAGFNLRRGGLARKSEWATVRSRLVRAGSLLALILLITATSLTLSYLGKARRAEALKEQTVDIFRQTFPGKRALEHQVALQLRNEYQELEKRARLLGVDRTGSALEVLRIISESSDPQVDYRLSDLSYSADSLRLEGKAPSFDAVNSLSSRLDQSPLFREVQIADAKMTADGSEVEFRLNLPIVSGGAS